jgi:hypothetical protein
MAYKTEKLVLQSQSIAGVRHWTYSDTGSTVVLAAGDGFFSDGRTKGMKVGDVVFVSTPTEADHLVITAVQATDTGGQYAQAGDTGSA